MARQKLTKPNSTTALAKLVVRIWEDDLKFIQEHYPDNYNAQVRRIISNWVSEQQEGVFEEWDESWPKQ